MCSFSFSPLFVLLGLLWTWTFGFVSVINFGTSLALISVNVIPVLFSLSSPITHLWGCLFPSLWKLFSMLFFFFFPTLFHCCVTVLIIPTDLFSCSLMILLALPSLLVAPFRSVVRLCSCFSFLEFPWILSHGLHICANGSRLMMRIDLLFCYNLYYVAGMYLKFPMW